MPLTPGEYKDRIFHDLNVERVNHGVRRVARGGKLDSSAQDYANKLASNRGPLRHGRWIKRLRKHGVTQPIIGEILADGNWTPEQTVAKWMASDEHRPIVLSGLFDDAGVGAALDPKNQVWWVVVDWAGG